MYSLKKINKLYLLSFLIVVMNIPSQAQQKQEVNFDELIQELFPQQEEDLNYEDIYASLLQYYSSPIDLNKATTDELNQLYILSPIQLKNFIEYRNYAGALLSIYELQAIPGFDYHTIQKLLPFVTITDHSYNTKDLTKKLFDNNNHYMLLRHEQIPTDARYTGDENKIYIKYKNSRSKDFSYGITMEKDGGEKIKWSPSTRKYGFDFLSYHFNLFNKGKLKALSIGDYQLQFGQGLVLSSGFSLGKGSETILTTKRNNSGINPYSSAMEFGFYRGAAITVCEGLTEFTSFYSNKFIDGSLQSDETTFSPVNTGYHRTENELLKRSTINEQIYGGNISIRNRARNLHGGLTFVKTLYDEYLKKTPTIYNTFDFEGNQNHTIGMDINYQYQNFIFFGETAMSKGRGKGIVTGFISNLSKQLEASIVFRNYERNFHSFYGNAFGENTNNSNEKGIYLGLKFKPSSHWTFSCYLDQFIFPWLKYQVDAPSHGYEYLGKLSYQPNKVTKIYLQFREENKEKNLSDNLSVIDYPVASIKRNFLFCVETKASASITTKTRLQLSSYNQLSSTTHGFAIMNDLEWRMRLVTLAVRFALFDTDDYENRQYAYEKDVLYSFSIPAYYGKGTRVNVFLKLKPIKKVDAWIKYSKTNYIDKKVAQNELNTAGIPLSNIRLQLRYSF